MTQTASKTSPKLIALMAVFYIVAMATGVGVLNYARNWAQSNLANEESLRDWQDWRQVTADQEAGDGPVTRRKAKSPEPPMLVLLRDHYSVCLSSWLILGTGVVLPFCWMIVGVFTQRNGQPSAAPNEST